MKRIIAVLALIFSLSVIVSSINATDTRLVWTFFWEGLNVELYVPYQAYPNDTMTIRIRVEAREDLQDVTIRFRIYGSKSEGYLGWFNSFYALVIGFVGNIWFLLTPFVEEPWLREQFKEEYYDYYKKVPRFI